LVLTFCLLLLLAKTAQAQQTDAPQPDARNDASDSETSVRDRDRPEYDPLGITLGAFRLYPELTTFVLASDNVFAEDEDPRSDTALGLELSARLASLWSSHALSMSLEADSLSYADFNELDRVNWSVGADGRLDVTRNFAATGAVSYADRHEELRNSELSDQLAEPGPYTQAGARLGAQNQFNRLRLSANASIDDYAYDSVALEAGGILDQSDRDRVVSQITGRADYSTSPRSTIFLAVARNWRVYDRRPPEVLVDRNSAGWTALVGSSFDITRLIRGEVGVGYLSQDYDAPDVDDTSGLAFQSSIEWLPDPLITVSLGAERGIRDANVPGAAAYVGNELSLAVDYEFRRNIILGASLQGGVNDYRGLDREDNYVRIGASADYLINRSVSAFASVSRDRVTSSNDLGREYDLNRFMAGLRLRR
jgi:hypothetical protein